MMRGESEEEEGKKEREVDYEDRKKKMKKKKEVFWSWTAWFRWDRWRGFNRNRKNVHKSIKTENSLKEGRKENSNNIQYNLLLKHFFTKYLFYYKICTSVFVLEHSILKQNHANWEGGSSCWCAMLSQNSRTFCQIEAKRVRKQKTHEIRYGGILCRDADMKTKPESNSTCQHFSWCVLLCLYLADGGVCHTEFLPSKFSVDFGNSRWKHNLIWKTISYLGVFIHTVPHTAAGVRLFAVEVLFWLFIYNSTTPSYVYRSYDNIARSLTLT